MMGLQVQILRGLGSVILVIVMDDHVVMGPLTQEKIVIEQRIVVQVVCVMVVLCRVMVSVFLQVCEHV